MIKISKYEFNSKEQAQEKIEALGEEHKHTVKELGFIALNQAEIDEEGNVITQPTYSDKYCVDVAWIDIDSHPYGWKTYAINLDNEGVHSFYGVPYLDNKL